MKCWILRVEIDFNDGVEDFVLGFPLGVYSTKDRAKEAASMTVTGNLHWCVDENPDKATESWNGPGYEIFYRGQPILDGGLIIEPFSLDGNPEFASVNVEKNQ